MQEFRRTLDRVLIVEDNAPLRAAISELVRSWDAEALAAGTAREAIELLGSSPTLVICDVKLPDESGLVVLAATLSLRPEPAKIAISGCATPEEAFRLGQLGVQSYLAKPFSLADLSTAVGRVLSEAPDFDPLLRASVGHVPMRELQRRVRSIMVEQALGLSLGSRSGAARLLDVSRQAVQQSLRTPDYRDSPTAAKSEKPASDDVGLPGGGATPGP